MARTKWSSLGNILTLNLNRWDVWDSSFYIFYLLFNSASSTMSKESIFYNVFKHWITFNSLFCQLPKHKNLNILEHVFHNYYIRNNIIDSNGFIVLSGSVTSLNSFIPKCVIMLSSNIVINIDLLTLFDLKIQHLVD